MTFPEKVKRRSRLERTAFHEAGHAVVMHFNGRGPLYMALFPKRDEVVGVLSGEGCPGYTARTDLVDPESCDAETAAQEIEMLLAGPAAEERYTGQWNDRGALDDLRSAREFARSAVSSAADLGPYLDRAQERVKSFLNGAEVWAAVGRIATALARNKRKRLERARIAELIWEGKSTETASALKAAYEKMSADRNSDCARTEVGLRAARPRAAEARPGESSGAGARSGS
jgi:hypothetical protein